jgi:hypothetical protein
MVSWQENKARVQDYFRFSKQEIIGFIVSILVTAFIFSFRDWGVDAFEAGTGFRHLLILIIIVAISLIFRTSCQKIYGLTQGYKAEFKVWWVGLVIAFVIAVISQGYIPLVLAGTMSVSFMVRQRLGEFRYGFSHSENAVISYWGIAGNLILAILFAIGGFFVPESYFFSKGLILNLIMAFTSLIPIPQLDGLNIFFGSRVLYFMAIIVSLLGAILLLSGTKMGLIIAIFVGTIYAIVYLLKGSEK